jgi:endonuclease YncB( thermonuclease family)
MRRAVVLLLASLLAMPAAAQECKLITLGTGEVASVRDGRTLMLTDGSEVRLAGIEVSGDSRSALQQAIGGGAIRLESLNPERDRYGRIVALVFAGGAQRSVQEAMLEQGQARVAARIGSKPCAERLFAAERQARAEKRGLWADPNFAPLPPDNLDRLRAQRGRFTIIEGKVLSVRDSGGTIYVNFGARWSQGFSVIILRRNQRIFNAAGVEPKRLEGRRIRVRGVLEERRGPVIEADVPEQIEFADDTMTNAQGTRQ